jgi:putative ABC transport system permease protein
MRRLGLELGDTLTFLIFGEEVTLPITSIRAVDWQSMRANFYFIFPPSALEHFPASCLANTYLPDDRRDDLVDLRLGYPNITILDVAVFVAQAQGFISAITYTVGVFIGVLSLFGLMAFLMVLSRQSEQKAEQELAMQRLGLSVKDYPVMRDELSCVLGIATIFSMTVGAGLVMAVNQFLSVKWQFDWYSYVILIAPWALILPYVLIRNHPKLIEGEL